MFVMIKENLPKSSKWYSEKRYARKVFEIVEDELDGKTVYKLINEPAWIMPEDCSQMYFREREI